VLFRSISETCIRNGIGSRPSASDSTPTAASSVPTCASCSSTEVWSGRPGRHLAARAPIGRNSATGAITPGAGGNACFQGAPCLLPPFPGTVGRYREAFPHLAVFLLGVYCTVEHGPAGCA